jgi:membrane-bound metal-dependent hydrolase YbcI (DUF457 family)
MKTHLAIGAFLVLAFLPHSTFKTIFLIVTLITSIIPDIDTAFSTVGKSKFLRLVQWLTKHRGIFHSFTFCVLISIAIALIFPPAAFPFFLGYGIHLFADSFTIDGIRPFWPLNISASGKITTGGRIEYILFVFFCILDVLRFISWFV